MYPSFSSSFLVKKKSNTFVFFQTEEQHFSLKKNKEEQHFLFFQKEEQEESLGVDRDRVRIQK